MKIALYTLFGKVSKQPVAITSGICSCCIQASHSVSMAGSRATVTLYNIITAHPVTSYRLFAGSASTGYHTESPHKNTAHYRACLASQGYK